MNIGRKIYYAKSNGLIVWDKGEMSGSVVQTTFEQDKVTMPILAMLPTEEIGVLEFEYGAGSFTSGACLVDTDKKELKYSGNPVPVQTTIVELTLDEKLAALEAKIDSILVKQDEIKAEQLAAKQAILDEKI